MNHSFNVEVAKDVGVLAATMFNNIGFWVDNNKANGRNLHDGKYWTYNSIRAFAEQFPYATESQISGALRKLRDAGYLETGQYCEDQRDRSLWYTLSPRGHEIFYGYAFVPQEDSIPQNKRIQNANSQNTIYTDINPDENADKDPFKEIIAYLNERTGKSYRLGKNTRKLINARLSEGYSVDDFKKVIDVKCAEWNGTDFEKYLQPSTLFAPSHFDEYLNTDMPKKPRKQQRQMDISEYGQPKPGDQRYDSSTGVTEVYQQNGTWRACEPSADEGWYEDIDC